jgi:hypothetical protein
MKTSPQELADQAYQLCLKIIDHMDITLEKDNTMTLPYSKRLVKIHGLAFKRFTRRKKAYEHFSAY